ncbi:MAG: NAD(P)H-hydrate dehydratase [Euryarchaeota archaeon]|nr:NAD(P)H-hydrate dehydratase [Euryarchaeota archaeon]
MRLYAPTESTQAAQVVQPDLVVHPGLEPRRLVPEDAARLRGLLDRVDVLLIGPGLGDDPETADAVERILGDAAKAHLGTVIDADAQAVAGRDPRLLRRLRLLCTPHHGEFKELTGRRMPKDEAGQAAAAKDEARRLGLTLLVKGPVDHITDGRRAKANRIHHPAMTTGGTGDVLAGLCAGFVAKGMAAFHAACAAAFVNGEAGRRVASRQGGSLVATDLLREIPRVFRAWLR